MDIIIKHLPILIPIFLGVIICAFLSVRTRFTALFTALEAILALFAFCFLIFAGTTLNELLLTVMAMLLPSLFCFGAERRKNK